MSKRKCGCIYTNRSNTSKALIDMYGTGSLISRCQMHEEEYQAGIIKHEKETKIRKIKEHLKQIELLLYDFTV